MGPVVTGVDVREALQETLVKWLPSTLAHVCRSRGMAADALKPPRVDNYHHMISAARLLELREQMPVIVIAAPEDGWERDQDGIYRTEWLTTVSVATRGRSFNETITFNDLYRAAIRLALAQHASLGGFAAGLTLMGGTQEPVGDGDRTVLLGTVEASVIVDRTLIDIVGPKEPPADPLAEPPPAPVIETVVVDTEPLSPVWS